MSCDSDIAATSKKSTDFFGNIETVLIDDCCATSPSLSRIVFDAGTFGK